MRWVGGLGLLALALASAHQMPIWASNRSLWTHVVGNTPNSARAEMNLAAAWMEAGDCARSLEPFSIAAALASDPAACRVLVQQRDWRAVFCPGEPLPPSACWP